MTEAQLRTIPVLLERKDALVKSQTGSGKTLAYAIPIVEVCWNAQSFDFISMRYILPTNHQLIEIAEYKTQD